MGMFVPGVVAAAPSDPSAWPAEAGRDPELTATEDTIRFAGSDRYQTNLALNLGLRGTGGFPFTTSDRTGTWWGAASCPRSILVVAGDTFADALAAASLSDPTDRSDQPRLRRVASTDPVFNPPGSVDRVDTAIAPIVVTESTRGGATALAASARATAEDMAAGGCTTAREAVIIGGLAAVPVGVEAELIALGYREVFRVAGTDRYDTAGQVALALGTGTPTGLACADTQFDDGRTSLGWHGNAVAEYRPDAGSCRLLPRAVVLADGDTGADALAAGWWTSYWQVPVLLTASDGSLPPATRDTLAAMAIDTLIVLGGTGRIPEATVEEARGLASSEAGRVAGADRYETSLAMARVFGGWWATGRPADFSGDRACLAASSGSGASAVGWPDALAAAPFCGRLTAARTPAPVRLRRDGTPVGGGAPAHDAAPILLTPTGAAALPGSVRDGLAAAFVSDTGAGFGVVFGGPAVVPAAAAAELGSLVAGFPNGAASPTLRDTFATALDLSLLYSEQGGSGRRVCQSRGSTTDVRWLSVYGEVQRERFVAERDLAGDRLTPSSSNDPFCLQLGDRRDPIVASGVAAAGTVGELTLIDLASETGMTGPVRQPAQLSSGGTRWTTEGRPLGLVEVHDPSKTTPATAASLDLQLSVTPGPRRVTGVASLRGRELDLLATIQADARLLNGVWHVRGQATLGAAPDGSTLVGGFTATVTPGTDGVGAAISWQLDAFPSVRG